MSGDPLRQRRRSEHRESRPAAQGIQSIDCEEPGAGRSPPPDRGPPPDGPDHRLVPVALRRGPGTTRPRRGRCRRALHERGLHDRRPRLRRAGASGRGSSTRRRRIRAARPALGARGGTSLSRASGSHPGAGVGAGASASRRTGSPRDRSGGPSRRPTCGLEVLGVERGRGERLTPGPGSGGEARRAARRSTGQVARGRRREGPADEAGAAPGGPRSHDGGAGPMACAATEGQVMTMATSPPGRAPASTELRRTRPRSYEEWKALRDWNRLPAWEPLRAGFTLRAAREAAGITQAELALRLGVSQQAVARVERASSNPTVQLLDSWSRALGARVLLDVVPGTRAGRKAGGG